MSPKKKLVAKNQSNAKGTQKIGKRSSSKREKSVENIAMVDLCDRQPTNKNMQMRAALDDHDAPQHAMLQLSATAGPDYEGPIGHKLREEARNAEAKSQNCKTDAKKALNSDTRNKLLQESLNYASLSKQLNQKAAEAIVAHNNKISKKSRDDFLDLHGLYIKEAVCELKKRFDLLEAKDFDTDLRLVTGAGKHSRGGKSVLKPVCIEVVKKRGYEFSEDTGSLLVKVLSLKRVIRPSSHITTSTSTSTTAITIPPREYESREEVTLWNRLGPKFIIKLLSGIVAIAVISTVVVVSVLYAT